MICQPYCTSLMQECDIVVCSGRLLAGSPDSTAASNVGPEEPPCRKGVQRCRAPCGKGVCHCGALWEREVLRHGKMHELWKDPVTFRVSATHSMRNNDITKGNSEWTKQF